MIYKTPKGIEVKSKEEYYFSLYLDELIVNGFVESYGYENNTFNLTPKVSSTYKNLSKTNKISIKEEFLLHPSTYTPDFTIIWTEKAKNIFYLDRNIPTRNKKIIPFRLACNDRLISYIEIKAENTFRYNASGDISFQVKQKMVYAIEKAYIQKIKPFINKKNSKCLFCNTFTPQVVVGMEIYKRNTAFASKGQSKLKYVNTDLNKFLKNFTNE